MQLSEVKRVRRAVMSDCETQTMPLGNKLMKGGPDSARQLDLDGDDFTTSSILEFLNQEKQCGDLDNGTEVDVESIFDEINRLSGDMDGRNVEDILREAEMLIMRQELGQLEPTKPTKSAKTVYKLTKCNAIKSCIPTDTKRVSLFCIHVLYPMT